MLHLGSDIMFTVLNYVLLMIICVLSVSLVMSIVYIIEYKKYVKDLLKVGRDSIEENRIKNSDNKTILTLLDGQEIFINTLEKKI